MPDTISLNPTMTVKEIITQFPETVAVFKQFGFDTCCGSGVAVAEAAHRDGIDVNVVMTALQGALSR